MSAELVPTASAHSDPALAGSALALVPPPPARAARAPFVVLVIMLLGGGLVALLLVNTALAQGAFTLHDLDRQSTVLNERTQQLERELSAAQQPAVLEQRARELGMIPVGTPGYLKAPGGALLGSPKPAAPTAAVTPTATVTPAADPSASPSIANPSGRAR